MNIRVYNTLSRQKEDFEPLTPGKVGIYLCGPTVYGPSHIGHMVGPVIFDTIKRYLTYSGFEVTWVVNITDVDDKLIKASNERGIPMEDVAAEMTEDYCQNLKALGIDQIDEMPKATDNMAEIITFIENLIEQDFAYAVDGDVFFDVGRDPEYGKLSNRTADSQQGEGGEVAAKKRSASDFALWKNAREGEPAWPSPWGEGRPGWHIECSAMSRGILGETFDIHGGGLDLVFPHHENEIAQSECCHGRPMVKYWLHNGLLKLASQGKIGGRNDRQEPSEDSIQQATDEKVSRSKKAAALAGLLARQTGERVRFFLLSTHYRSTIAFSEEGIEETGTAMEAFTRLFERYQRISGQDFYEIQPIADRKAGEIDSDGNALLDSVADRRLSFLANMDDDFNTGGATSDLFEQVRSINRYIDGNDLESAESRSEESLQALHRAMATLRELTSILGIFRQPPEVADDAKDDLVDELMDIIIAVRAMARQNKNFEMADFIRDKLGEASVTLEDRKDGTGWRRS